MSMHYRGVTYEGSSKSLETQESNLIGQYRGACWKLHQGRRPGDNHDGPRLKYRGRWID